MIVSSSKYKYACSVQNINNYGLTLGTAYYYIILISQYCNYYIYQFFMCFSILIFLTFLDKQWNTYIVAVK